MLTPQLNIPDGAVADRVMAAFHNSGAEYKAWLKDAIRQKVLAFELETVQQQAADARVAKENEMQTLLDGAT